ncbi:MAG: hypothetical protein RR444_10070 [Oscillospiraceae bacterium]
MAGKKSLSDRVIEMDTGRFIYQAMANLENRVAANMVAINPGSWITNLIPLTQGYAELSTNAMLKAAKETVGNMKLDDGFVDKSSFLTNRRGSDVLSKTLIEKASHTLSSPMYYIDDFTSNVLTRARTIDNIKDGMDESDAIKEADKWAASVIGDRSKSSLPTVFNRKNPITKVLTMFQVESNNQLSHLFKDMPRDQREDGLKHLTFSLFKYMMGAYFYNELYEKLTGRRPALDGIGIVKESFKNFANKDMKTSQALKSTGTRIVEQVPFVGGLIGGGRLPISNALPDVGQLFKLTDNEVDSKKKFEIATKEIAKPLTYLGLPLGGGQIKKVVEGIGTVAKGGSYTYNNDGEKELQFPVFNKGIGEYAQGTLFGKYALPEAQKYIESGFKWLSAKQTKAYDLLVDGGEAAKKSFETIGKIKSVKGAEEKRNLLLDLPIKPNQKSLLDDWLIGERKNKIDYTDDDTFVLSQLTDSMQAKYKKNKKSNFILYNLKNI